MHYRHKVFQHVANVLELKKPLFIHHKESPMSCNISIVTSYCSVLYLKRLLKIVNSSDI